MTDEPSPAPQSGRRQWLWSGAGLVVMAIIYVVVLVLYGNSTRLDVSSAVEGISDDPKSVQVVLEVSKVDATAATISGTMQVSADAYADENARLVKSVTVDLVAVSAGPDADMAPLAVRSLSASFPKGRSSFGLSAPIEIRSAGDYQTYPFDTLRSELLAFVTVGPDSGELGGVPVNLLIVGDSPGWLIRNQPLEDEDGRDILADMAEADVTTTGRFATELYLTRAGSTKTFVMLLLAALLVMGVLSLAVARAVRTRRRRIEATMASWFAAMLFAVIPLRLNMPGAPPIGVWIDFIVLLWVELALMIGLAIFVGSWLRYTPAPELPAPSPEPASPPPDR